ncbi:MAG: glycosyltransferase family 2 protein [Campylobacter sp.]|nr:glycosyltransferase family 2 protein [Campylobacter sp.]
MKLSVLIATYNRVELLKRAVNSILSQDFDDFEVIISDDNSTDETAQFCQNLQDKRVKYFINKNHIKGPNGNKNNALSHASGEYLCFVDDDDALMPNALSECMKFIGEYDSVFADYLCEKNGVLTQSIAGRSPYSKSGEMSKIDYHCGRINGEFFKIFSRKFVENFALDERSFGGENELYIRFFEGRVYYLKKALYIYRTLGEDSATKNAAKHAKKVANAYLKTVKLHYDIAIKHEPSFIALQYKNAAYYAKLAGDFSLMYKCIFKSLGVKFNKEAFVFLLLSPLPNAFIQSLSHFRVWIKQRFGI